ncbi:nucleotide sugar dehydrogenase [Turicimonas muris]
MTKYLTDSSRKQKMKIAVFGTGYVGLSLSVLLAQKNEVVAVDVLEKKVELINKKISPIVDAKLQSFLSNKKLNLLATLDAELALKDADFLIIATPTNYDPQTNNFDTSSVEQVISLASNLEFKGTIVIKSTVPVGFTNKINTEGYSNVIFSPEFLREGFALQDNLFPSRIVVGGNRVASEKFAKLLLDAAEKKNVPCLFTGPTEAEAIKLFSNTYLAMRISFFNELDTFALTENLNTKKIIEGVCLDPRIGGDYCNPSFGYGGYCLPKDTKQLLSNYQKIPQELIGATVGSNRVRKEFITQQVINLNPQVVGIFRLVMKRNSDNFRESAIFDIIENLSKRGIEIIIYEPTLRSTLYQGKKVLQDLSQFKKVSNVILANRWDHSLEDVRYKVYTRDVFYTD